MNIAQQGMAVVALLGAPVAFRNKYRLERVKKHLRKFEAELRQIRRKERAEGIEELKEEKRELKGNG